MRAVLFDMDGVLVDVSTSYRRAILDTVQELAGRAATGADVQRLKDRGGFNDDWKLTAALIAETGADVPFETVVDRFQRRYRGAAHTDEAGAWDGLIASETPLVPPGLFEALRGDGYVLGLVTGRPEAEARYAIRTHGWEDLFAVFVPMEAQAGRGKPDPYPLLLALGALAGLGHDVAPEEAAYVGDTGDDMVAARAAGLTAIGFVPPYLPAAHADTLRDRGAHTVLHDLSDLPAALRMR
jgi:HAD superfamily phosphatase